MPKAESSFQIRIDARSAVPAYEQIKRAIKLAVLSGRLKNGEQLPTLRDLALSLMVNPNTIIKVYDQLENEGFVYARSGSGYFVKLDPAKFHQESHELFREVTRDYIAKAVDLGYSAEQVLAEIAALTQIGVPVAKKRDRRHDRHQRALV